jgi:hypothetical protein
MQADASPMQDDFAYYINDGVYGAFNNIMFDHVPGEHGKTFDGYRPLASLYSKMSNKMHLTINILLSGLTHCNMAHQI